MNFTPKTEKEIQEQMLWPKGEYDFEVVKAEPAKSGPQSKNPGTDFIKLSVKIFNEDGGSRLVNGILHPAMEAQLRHFCYGTGLGDVYEAGTLRADHCEGRSGKLKLKVKDAEGNYPAKNEIQDFIVPEPKPEVPAPKELDDVPF